MDVCWVSMGHSVWGLWVCWVGMGLIWVLWAFGSLGLLGLWVFWVFVSSGSQKKNIYLQMIPMECTDILPARQTIFVNQHP